MIMMMIFTGTHRPHSIPCYFYNGFCMSLKTQRQEVKFLHKVTFLMHPPTAISRSTHRLKSDLPSHAHLDVCSGAVAFSINI